MIDNSTTCTQTLQQLTLNNGIELARPGTYRDIVFRVLKNLQKCGMVDDDSLYLTIKLISQNQLPFLSYHFSVTISQNRKFEEEFQLYWGELLCKLRGIQSFAIFKCKITAQIL